MFEVIEVLARPTKTVHPATPNIFGITQLLDILKLLVPGTL
jgi:hypothetical protein